METTFNTAYKPKPPPAPRAVATEDVPNIDALLALPMTQRAIAKRLDIHWRTVGAIARREGAYKDIPKAKEQL